MRIELDLSWRHLLAGGLLLAAASGAGWMLWPRPAPPLVVSAPTPRPSPSAAAEVVVHVVGAVHNPGVYRLPAGARVSDAIAQAGGLTESADAASINLAGRLADGQQISVATLGAASRPEATAETTAARAARVNLNRASAAELDTLPGIGPVTAQRIIERRQRLGPFERVEQLLEEKLVPGSTFERIKDLVSLD